VAKVQIKGMDKLHKALLECNELALKEARKAVAITALNIEREAKHRSPVDTGRLRASIRHQIDPNGLEGQVLTDVDYAPYMEFGTSRTAPQPFLNPAADLEQPEFVKRLEAIGQKLESVRP
jgi:HK97 gp10 family phage protein